LVCRSGHKLGLLLQSSRELLVCRSCRGGQLLLPNAAKVTKNALGCDSPLRRTLRQLGAVQVPHRRAPPNSRMAQTCGGTHRKKTADKAAFLRYPRFTIFNFVVLACGRGLLIVTSQGFMTI